MRKLGKRVYKTADGKYVPEGHKDAAYLAYSQYDEVPDEVAAQLEQKPRRKAQPKPDDKAVGKPEDK